MFTVDYYIAKFGAQHEDDFAVGHFVSIDGNKVKRCANGMCGVGLGKEITSEGVELNKLFLMLPLTNIDSEGRDFKNDLFWMPVAAVNDRVVQEYQQPTAKERILAALYDIKEMQSAVDYINQENENSKAYSFQPEGDFVQDSHV